MIDKYLFGCLLVLTLWVLSGCNGIRWSQISKEGRIYQTYYQHYYNDSLALYVRFYGGHILSSDPNSIRRIPDSVLRSLRKECRKMKISGKLVFISRQASKYFGYNYFGMIEKGREVESRFPKFEKRQSGNGSVFFEGPMVRKDKYFVKPFIIPLKYGNFWILSMKHSKPDSPRGQYSDSSMLQENSFREMMTLKANERYIPYASHKQSNMDSLMDILNKDRYLRALKKVQKLESGFLRGKDSSSYSQLLLTCYSFLDEIDSMRNILHPKKLNDSNSISESAGSSESLNLLNQHAVKKVLEEASRHRVLMFNESHYDWRHRFFVTTLLDSLYGLGYRYLAMEALARDKGLSKRGYPTVETGFYVREPYMADLIRRALKKGFTLVPYEDTTLDIDNETFSSQVDKREYMQASNLYHEFKKDQVGKWIILAGYGHINKLKLTNDGQESMAMYFREMSHVEPYCIDQPHFSDLLFENTPAKNLPLGFYYLSPEQVGDSELLKQCDLYVANNLESQPYEQDKIWTNGCFRYTVILNSDILGLPDHKGEKVLMVYRSKELQEPGECIPIYICRIRRLKQSRFILTLPIDNYTAIIRDEDDKELFNTQLIR